MRILEINKRYAGTPFIPELPLKLLSRDLFELTVELTCNDEEKTIYDFQKEGTTFSLQEDLEIKIDNSAISGMLKHTNVRVEMPRLKYGVLSYKHGVIPRKVIFNNPATIVFWNDDTKTVVKAQDGEKYDEEKGLAMCIVKKALGNKGNYYDVIKRWIDET